jgi:hypothetical protein
MKRTYSPRKISIDHMIAVIFSVALQYLSPKNDIYCIEVKCRAQKDVTQCEFVASTEKGILDYLKKFGNKKSIERAQEVIKDIKEVEKKLGIKYD